MNIEEYLRQEHPGANAKTLEYARGLAGPRQHDDGTVFVEGGVLVFTAESAPWWGGPFPGNCAVYRLEDCRATTYPARRKGEPRRLVTEMGSEYAARHPKERPEMVTVDKPVQLKLYGNDDTSYTKFYATVDEALAELRLFEGNQPLDFQQVVEGFNFVFTN